VEGRLGYSNEELVGLAKRMCGVTDLTDESIASICRFIGRYAPDTKHIGGKVVYGEIGISLMLSVALYAFPDFYQRHELWQRN